MARMQKKSKRRAELRRELRAKGLVPHEIWLSSHADQFVTYYKKKRHCKSLSVAVREIIKDYYLANKNQFFDFKLKKPK